MTVRILCVEDNPQNMRLVRKILKSQGYDVIEAEDGYSGLNMAETQNPDLILMDINLPDIDGLEVTRRIKAQDHLKPIPIVALTANAMFGDEERCLEAGCNGYIAKPVSKQKLLANLENYLVSASNNGASFDSGTDTDALETTSQGDESSPITDPIETESAETIIEIVKPVSSNSNGQGSNISTFRQSNSRHRFRQSSARSKPNLENAPKNGSDKQDDRNNA